MVISILSDIFKKVQDLKVEETDSKGMIIFNWFINGYREVKQVIKFKELQLWLHICIITLSL